MFNPRRSVAARLLISQVLMLVAGLGITGTVLYRSIIDGIHARGQDSARSLLIQLEETLSEDPTLLRTPFLQPLALRVVARIADIKRLSVIDRLQIVTADSDSQLVGRTTDDRALIEVLQTGVEQDLTSLGDSEHRYRIAHAVRGPYDPRAHTSTIGAIAIEMDLGAAEARMGRAFTRSMLLLGGLLLLLVAGQYADLRRTFIWPLRRIAWAMDRFGKGDTSQRAPIRTMDETGRVAGAFNRMAEHIVENSERSSALNTRLQSELAERERAERALRASEEKFRTVVNTAAYAVVSADRDGKTRLFNRAAEAMFGYATAEVIGQPVTCLMPERFQPAYLENLAGIVGDTVELVGRRRNGEEFPIELSLAAWQSDDETFFTAIMRDLTEHKAAEEAVRARKAALEAARLKSEFLASMSHEIRTPLNGVIGMTGMLLDTALSPEQREYAETTRTSADHLLGVINDILDFSKVEAGQMHIEPISFDLQTTVEEVIDMVSTTATEKGLDVIVRLAPGMPRRVIGDAGRIRQILTNLVGNAIKFTTAGHVLLDVHCEKTTETEAWLRVSVEDTGIGIPPDKLDHIFERFTQADASTSRRYGGTGLGLAIAKQLIELMGGSIGVTSRLGAGSTFRFSLPLGTDLAAAEGPVDAEGLTGVRVLVVDESTVGRRVLHEHVLSWGMRNGSVTSVVEALEVLGRARATGDPYRVAIIDEDLAGGEGKGLVHAIKHTSDLRNTALVVLVSANRRIDAGSLVKAGVAAYVLKPVRPSKLMDALATACGEREREPAAEPARRLRPGRRVLLVEDNPVNQKVAVRMLEKLGCRVDLAANGKEAVMMVTALPYDVVFMDCEMPEMDGYEAAGVIRRSEAPGRRVPIMAMTAHALAGDREKCLAAGMDDYISKPVRRDDLARALDMWALARTTGAAPADAVSKPGIEASLVDLQQLREAAGGDPEAVLGLVGTYLRETDDLMGRLRTAIGSGAAKEMGQIAHGCAGSSAQLGLASVVPIFRRLEEMSKQGRLTDTADLVEELERELERARVFLRAHVSPTQSPRGS
jgi:two-component system sensor histidine kinase/response regulator